MVVLLDGKAIYRGDFTICRRSRAEADSAPKQPTRVFRFAGGHVFQGEYHTKPSDTVEGDIWLSGSDPEDLIFGVSFTVKDQVLLNTVHIAKPNAASHFDQDRGLVTKTYPLKHSGPG
jgi:hypothetical protein